MHHHSGTVGDGVNDGEMKREKRGIDGGDGSGGARREMKKVQSGEGRMGNSQGS